MLESFIDRLNTKFVWDGRWLIVAALIIYFSIIAASHFFLGSYVIGWSKLGVQIIPSFVDLKILMCGLDATRQGLDPYTYSCQDIGIYYNYPGLWKFFSYFPFLTAKNTNIIGITQLVLFFVLILWFIGKQNFQSGIFYSLFLCSPALMLAVERGNCDLWMFFLIVSGIFLFKYPRIQYLFIIMASLLKFFPIGAIACIPEKGKKQRWILAGIILVAFVLYLLLIRHNVLHIVTLTPRPFDILCYGLDDIPKRLEHSFSIPIMVARIGWYSLLATGLFLFSKRIKSTPEYFSSSIQEHGFMVGAGIYLTSYFIVQSNFEYRLIFLIPALPQLLEWVKKGFTISKTMLILLGLMVWEHFIDLSIQHLLPFPHYLWINQFLTAIFTVLLLFQFFILFLNKINLMKRLF